MSLTMEEQIRAELDKEALEALRAYSDVTLPEDIEVPLVRKFWAHDPPRRGGAKGHPRVLVAFKVDGDDITYAAVTWNPVEKFDRQHAIKRVEGRLKCPKRQRRTTSKGLNAHQAILEDIVQRDIIQGRTNTYRYQACSYTLKHKV